MLARESGHFSRAGSNAGLATRRQKLLWTYGGAKYGGETGCDSCRERLTGLRSHLRRSQVGGAQNWAREVANFCQKRFALSEFAEVWGARAARIRKPPVKARMLTGR